MRTNEDWPESFGFVIGGRAPVVILSVRANSVAQKAGLQPGDQILELNGENVQGLSKEEITLLARRSRRVPPALAVISRIRNFQLRRKRGTFGFTVWGKGPVYINQVDRGGAAHSSGIKSGDLILQINSVHVRHSNREQVEQIIEACGPVLSIVLIAGSHSIGSAEKRGGGSSTSRYRYARDFYYQMNYYLAGQESKKGQLMKFLNQYAKDRSVEQLCKNLNMILQTPIQRKLLKDIRPLIPKKHRPLYDVLVGTNPSVVKRQPLQGGSLARHRPVSSASGYLSDYDDSEYIDSLSKQDGYRTWSRGTSTPISDHIGSTHVEPPRNVQVRRAGTGAGFGFILTGDAPVCIRSVDRGSPAAAANLRPGDHILAINGLNVRGKSHGHVVDLLKGSGSTPTLLVQWRPNNALISSPSIPSSRSVSFGNARHGPTVSRSSSRLTQTSYGTEYLPNRAGIGVHEHRGLARQFKYYMNQLLTPGEQLVVKQSLHNYQKDRNIPKLLRALEPVLDDAEKLQMLHYLSDLLPANEQEPFDRAAALLIAKYMESGIVPGSRTTDSEVMDVLYRVQGSRLNENPRPRNVIGGGSVSPDSPRQMPREGAVTQNRWNDISHVGGELDTVPVRDRNGVTVGTASDKKKVDDDEEDGDDYDDDLDLGLVELADALIALDAEKAAKDSQSQNSTIQVKADVHSPTRTSQQHPAVPNGTIVPLEELPVDAVELSTQCDNVPEDLKGLTAEELRAALATRTQQLEQARNEVLEASRRADRAEQAGQNDAGSKASSPSSHADLASAIKARTENEDTSSEVVKTAGVPPPPPPPGAPPPPPPPPPPSLAPPLPPGGLKVDGSPRMQLKRVNWEKLSIAGIENTVWAQLHDDKEPLDNVIEFMQLEQNFSAIQKKRSSKEEKKPNKPTILDPKKSYNISILLGHLKMSFDEIRQAMMSMQENKFSEAHLRQLLLYAPDGSELQKYKYFADDSSKLDIADRFSLEMSKVPGYTQRLRALLFKARFADRVDEIKPDLEAVIQASQDLQANTKMMQILKLVLATGNYMNKGNARIAGATGFKISFLTKLSSTKTTDNKSTLLHVLVSTIENKYPEVLDVKKELESVLVAAKVSYQMVASDIGELEKGMTEMRKDLGVFKSRQSRLEGDRFNEAVNEIISSTEGELQTILDLQTKMMTKFNDVVKFYGENEAKMTTEDFFGYFAVFLVNFDRTRLEISKKAQLEEEKAKREKQREERSKKLKEVKEKGQSDESVAEFSKNFEAISLKRQMRKVSEEGSASPLSGDSFSLSSGEFDFHKIERSKSTSSTDSSQSNKSEILSPKITNESPQTGNTPSSLSNTVVNNNESGRPYSVRENEMVLNKVVPKSTALSAKDSLLLKPKPAPKPKPKPAIASKPKVDIMKPSGSSKPIMDRQPNSEKDTIDIKIADSCMRTGIKTTDEYSEIVLKETPEIPHQKGVKGISSMFESKMSDVDREKMYAKPVKSVEKKNKSSEKKDSSAAEEKDDEIPPPIPPKIDEALLFSSPDSPYNDPGPPDFRPPPPPWINKDIETPVCLTEEATSTEEENPYADITPVVAPKEVSPYSDVDVISIISTPPPAFKDTRVFSEDKEPDSNENSLYEDVEINLTRKKTSTEGRTANQQTSGEVSCISQTPPEKPPPYKPKQNSLPSDSSEKQNLVHEKSLPSSPQFAVVMPGSPRLASAEIKSNSSTDVKDTGSFVPHSRETTPKPFTGKVLSSGNSSPRPSPPPPIRVSSLKSSPSPSSRNSLNASPVAANTSPVVPHLNLEDNIQEQISLSSPDYEYALPSFELPPALHPQSVLHSPPIHVNPERSGNSLAYIKELNERNLNGDRESVEKMICPPPPKFSPIPSRRELSESNNQATKHENDSNLDSLIIPPPPPSEGPPSPHPNDIGFDFLSLPVEEEDPLLLNFVPPPPSQTPLLPNFSQSTSQVIASPLTNNSQLSVNLEDLDEIPSRDIGATVRENMMRPLVPPMRKQR